MSLENDPELYRSAVENNGCALEFVPDKFKTPQLCRLAVEKDGMALRFVPLHLRTPELCRLAVEKNGSAIQFFEKDNFERVLCGAILFSIFFTSIFMIFYSF